MMIKEIPPPLTDEKEKHLRSIIRECESLVIAYSGGVDSTLVAKIAHQELGKRSLMVIADSPSLPRKELQEALALGEEHGFPIRVIATDETDNPLYRANTGNRCYFCKQTLYRYLKEVREELGFRFLANGDHREDRSAHRPGQAAAREQEVRSVLAEADFTKAEVRGLAKKLGLPNHDKPAAPCLSSRIPVGSEVTPEKLQQIEEAEYFLKNRYGIRDLRVRHLGKQARIETLPEYFSLIEEHREEVGNRIAELGFREWYLSPEPLQSGSFSHRSPRETIIPPPW